MLLLLLFFQETCLSSLLYTGSVIHEFLLLLLLLTSGYLYLESSMTKGKILLGTQMWPFSVQLVGFLAATSSSRSDDVTPRVSLLACLSACLSPYFS